MRAYLSFPLSYTIFPFQTFIQELMKANNPLLVQTLMTDNGMIFTHYVIPIFQLGKLRLRKGKKALSSTKPMEWVRDDGLESRVTFVLRVCVLSVIWDCPQPLRPRLNP